MFFLDAAMASDLSIVILLLWGVQCGAESLDVQDTSLIQIAFANETVKPTCKITMICKPEYANFTISYYRSDLEGKEITIYKYDYKTQPACSVNTTFTTRYKLQITPTRHASVTGTYYCKVAWKPSTIRRGNGTFILFREKGYFLAEKTSTIWICLITVIILLAALSIVGTVLLAWKREVVWPWKNHVKKCPDKRSTPQHISSSLEPPESMYTDLQPHQPDIYIDFQKNLSNPSYTGMSKTKDIQGEIQDVYENNSTDVYENI
ncbi:NFAT activation molecule 1 [Sceloporus undulatus]|uniref:NFAT activation molecule 1 n=1 Tax=Sceloporus undulatus TaxID=8520 RepID=UPI001C4C3C41|nr:NFAT activation molecule 1 [Sceloporus undulatus]XP_042323710.1 NFAT activation molecule 1 [Sceloporus undulatus]XP_042323711.1 NFAT activation molecule 1 [Sceloporus undulatus]